MKKHISLTQIRDFVFWMLMIVLMFHSLQKAGLVEIQISNPAFISLSMIFLCSVTVHLYNSTQKPDYLRNRILLFDKDGDRSARYDYLRVLAVIFVIITHAIQEDIAKGVIQGDTKVFIYTIVYVLTLSCNSIYVMLSGALLLPYKEEKMVDFYAKRIVKVVLPLVIYYTFYLWQNMELTDLTLDRVNEILLRLIRGNTYESPHFWLIYTILSIYIVIPFLRYMMKELSYKKLTALTLIILLFMAADTFSANKPAVSTFLSSWTGVAIMGYWVSREETRKYDGILMLTGFGSALAAVYLIRTDADYLFHIANCSPIINLVTMGIFAVVLANKKIFGCGNWFIRIMSRYSYAMILIHWWSLYWVTIGRYGINTKNIMWMTISCLLTWIVSFQMGFLIDNLVVTTADFLLQRVTGFFRIIKRL